MRKEEIVKGFELSYRDALELHDSIFEERNDESTAEERMSCRDWPKLKFEYDKARYDYFPYCWEYGVWNEELFGRSVRNNVCLKHGRPALLEV